MRFTLNQKFLSTVSAIFLFILSSCDQDSSEFLEDGQPAVIIISDIGTGDKLVLKDLAGHPADTFFVRKGEKVEWLLLTDKVKDIKKIHEKEGNPNLFSIRPNRIGSSFHQHGKIKKDVETGKMEEYYIKWIDSAGNERTYDPKIQVQ